MTCRMPAVSLVAFEDRAGKFIFVRIPDSYGRYVRTDPCVALHPCPKCNSTVGEPCKTHGKYHAGIHASRSGRHRGKGRALPPEILNAKDVIDPCDGATVTIRDEVAA